MLLGTGLQLAGARKLILGLAFSPGFFLVALSEAVLFAEANLVLPATLLSDRRIWPRVLRFWALAWKGNLAGAWLFGKLITIAQIYPYDVLASLAATVEGKMAYRQLGGAESWWRVVVSGVLPDWLVGMAAFVAFMARPIIGKYFPVLLATATSWCPPVRSPHRRGPLTLDPELGGNRDADRLAAACRGPTRRDGRADA